MRCNEAGKALIKASESLRLDAYLCPRGIPTIGFGHTGDVQLGQTITEHQAEAIFDLDLGAVEDFVSEELDGELQVRELTENEFSALCSFGFNVGEHAEGHSTLMLLCQHGKFAEAANEFPKWIHSHDPAGNLTTLPGLTKRRAAERSLFLTPDGAE